MAYPPPPCPPPRFSKWQVPVIALALCGTVGRTKMTYGVPFVLCLPLLVLSLVATVGNLANADDVRAFVSGNWHLIQQLVGPNYSYQPADAYIGDSLGALRVRL
jgi:hypothetical protein